MPSIKTKLGKGGRLVIPAEYRKELGIRPGDDVIVVLEDNGDLRITTLEQEIQRAQEIVRRRIPDNVSLSDELIKERREEARRE